MKNTIISLTCCLAGTVLGAVIGYEVGNYLLDYDCIENKDANFVRNSIKFGGIIGGIGTLVVYIHITKSKINK